MSNSVASSRPQANALIPGLSSKFSQMQRKNSKKGYVASEKGNSKATQ